MEPRYDRDEVLDAVEGTFVYREQFLVERSLPIDHVYAYAAAMRGANYEIAASRRFQPIDRIEAIAHVLDYEAEFFYEKSEVENLPGLYFICDEDEVLYIGQSLEMKRRLTSHSQFAMDYVGVIYMEPHELRAAECLAIGLMRPAANFRNDPRYTSFDVNYDWRRNRD